LLNALAVVTKVKKLALWLLQSAKSASPMYECLLFGGIFIALKIR